MAPDAFPDGSCSSWVNRLSMISGTGDMKLLDLARQPRHPPTFGRLRSYVVSAIRVAFLAIGKLLPRALARVPSAGPDLQPRFRGDNCRELGYALDLGRGSRQIAWGARLPWPGVASGDAAQP